MMVVVVPRYYAFEVLRRVVDESLMVEAEKWGCW